MTVIIEKSICVDCDGRNTCQRLKRLSPGLTIRDEMIQKYEHGDIKKDELLYKLISTRSGRPKDIFEVIIVTCSMKNQYSFRKKNSVLTEKQKEENVLYYCNLCKSMHRLNSTMGRAHKPISDKML